jgi:hypothetical protein
MDFFPVFHAQQSFSTAMTTDDTWKFLNKRDAVVKEKVTPVCAASPIDGLEPPKP